MLSGKHQRTKTSLLISISCAQDLFLMSCKQSYIANSIITKNNICNACLESDCSCICSISGNHKAIDPVFKQTRNKKKLQIEWISCNSCSRWVHSICSGLKCNTT